MARSDLSVLRGRRVLITGAARGIGAALAEKLAAHGARLALVGLEPATMEQVAARCGSGTFVTECDAPATMTSSRPSMPPPRRSAAWTSSWPMRASPPAARCAPRTSVPGSA